MALHVFCAVSFTFCPCCVTFCLGRNLGSITVILCFGLDRVAFCLNCLLFSLVFSNFSLLGILALKAFLGAICTGIFLDNFSYVFGNYGLIMILPHCNGSQSQEIFGSI